MARFTTEFINRYIFDMGHLFWVTLSLYEYISEIKSSILGHPVSESESSVYRQTHNSSRFFRGPRVCVLRVRNYETGVILGPPVPAGLHNQLSLNVPPVFGVGRKWQH